MEFSYGGLESQVALVEELGSDPMTTHHMHTCLFPSTALVESVKPQQTAHACASGKVVWGWPNVI